jgi:transcriptional regulator with XRE-family HTH domain
MINTNTRFEDWLDEQMRDPEFRAAWEELEPAYQVTRLRIKRGLTQGELAKLVGTRQSSISRLESGKRQPSLSFLRRIAEALKARLVVQLVPEEESHVQEAEVVPGDRIEVVRVRYGVDLAQREPLIALWQAGPSSIDVRAVLAPDWPQLKTISWTDHTFQTTEAEKVI